MTINFDAAISQGDQSATSVVTNQRLDPAFAMQEIRESFLPSIDEMADQATALQITDEGSYKLAIDMAAQARRLNKKLEEARKEKIKEQDAFVRSVNKFVKPFKDRLASIDTDLKQKISVHARKLEQERREAERKAKAEAEQIQKELNKRASESGTEAVEVAAPVVPQQRVTRSDSGAAVHTRKKWTWELEDIKQVPAEYLEVKATAVNQAVKAGIRQIPGIRVFETEEAVLRS